MNIRKMFSPEGDGGAGNGGSGNAGTPAPAASGASNSAPPPAATTETDWKSGLSSDLKGYVETKGFKDPASILDSYRNFEKLMGVPRDQLLRLPEKSDDPEWTNIFKKLGKPEKPTDYNFPTKEGVQPDEKFNNWAKEVFHGANLTAKQAELVATKWDEYVEGIATAQANEIKTKETNEKEALKTAWGNAYDQNMKLAQQAAKTFAKDDKGEVITALQKVMGYDKTMKFFQEIGSKMSEHHFASGDGGSKVEILTPEAAQHKIKLKTQDKAFRERYLNKDADAVAEMVKLHELAYPDESANA